MTDLNDKHLAELEASLMRLREELQQQLDISRDASGVVTLDQTSVGRVSRIDAMQQQSMAISTRHKAETKLRRVEAAIAAMESGDYGYCRQCDEAIAHARLTAQPEASLCIQCQDKADRQQ